ncbi:hypothetical protein K443DRAFT_666541 [Laccaria amethystina LaAM-08-1]|uniref:F-box domain-containing protein n=1 Tax=Laccaria amethystina LaAM-08-1 TaxID=1095629 RepID=A0A0C9XEV9_9AGAR|nr:hypothetical protein K443DRAFT_666541 [Laccaria amethystina LaAM-08-1]
MHLPLEIIEQVIDELRDDIVTLKSTAQTCHALLPLCRKHIFRSIDLTPHSQVPCSYSPLSHLFQHVLNRNPDIGRYVRDLTLTLYVSNFPWHGGLTIPESLDSGICQSLTKLPQLHKLDITGGYSHRYNIHTKWNTIHPDHRQSLLHCIHSSSLTELRITNFEVPITIFRACFNLTILKNLSLRKGFQGEFLYMDQLSQPVNVAVPQLRCLEFQGQFIPKVVASRYSNGYPILRLHKLKTLIAQGDEIEAVQAVSEILREAREVENFTYMVYGSPHGFLGFAGWINRDAFSTLKILKVVCNAIENEDPLRGLSEELEAFPRTNVLDTLDINVAVETDNLFSTGGEWGRLDAVLSGNFVALRRVSIHIVIWIYQERPEIKTLHEELNKLPQTQFPWLSENTAIYFDFSTGVDYVRISPLSSNIFGAEMRVRFRKINGNYHLGEIDFIDLFEFEFGVDKGGVVEIGLYLFFGSVTV